MTSVKVGKVRDERYHTTYDLRHHDNIRVREGRYPKIQASPHAPSQHLRRYKLVWFESKVPYIVDGQRRGAAALTPVAIILFEGSRVKLLIVSLLLLIPCPAPFGILAE